VLARARGGAFRLERLQSDVSACCRKKRRRTTRREHDRGAQNEYATRTTEQCAANALAITAPTW